MAFSQTVKDLAKRFFEEGDCGFALHDCLLEEGYPEVAEHFDDHSPFTQCLVARNIDKYGMCWLDGKEFT